MASQASLLPDNVPAELVVESPLYERRTIYSNPYDTIIPAIHDGPEIVWATNAFPGKRPGWILRRAEDVRALLQDTDNFVKRGFARFAEGIGEHWVVIPTETDPPLHTRYRQALNPFFAPKNMNAMSDGIRQRARDLIAKFKDRGQCEFLDEFAVSYPVTIVLDLLGLPQERMAQFLEWEKQMLHTDDMEVRGNATRAVKAYLEAEIEARRRNPRDDYISRVLNFEIEGRKWNADEVFGHCFNLYLGGLDTVTSSLGLQFHHLATHPDHQNYLRAHPDKTVVAVEELLRAFAPVTSFRICEKEISYRGITFKPGDYVAVATPIVGRDPALYERPNEVRFDRKPAHFTLGGGPHKCLGMHLARRELQIAIEEFLSAIPQFRIEDDFAVPFHVGNILHVEALPLEWG